jgi:serine/threonine protein kinase/tetratricopeptide (TPR) repeat protein
MPQSSNILGKYELLEVIGDGAEGRVYRASCLASDIPGLAKGEFVALKRLKSTGHDKEFQQFRRQIEILQKLNHANIVRYKDSFVWREKELEEDIHCLVMELLDGQPLKSLLEQNHGGLPWAEAREILLQTLQALEYAAKNGVIHRDLKPSNIYITPGGMPKLIDFGIARQDDGEATATSSAAGAKGTFDYMAPDFALQHGGFRGDEQSDIFSFGVIMHYTLAGSLPFPALGEAADRGYFIRWLGKQPPVPEFRNPVFKVLSHSRSFINKCIAQDRNERFKTFAELMAEFNQIGYRKLRHGNETYEFIDWLGKGGFGEVYRARRVSDGRDVAVKRLFSSGQSSRFVREAKILRDAAHPHLTEYVDFVEVKLRDDEREYYLILEYLEGMPGAGLRDRIRETDSGLDPVEACQLFVCYLDCLDHLHKNGIIHRDIKPGNLYAPLNAPNKAKIFDLGIAHDEEGTRTHGQVPGTLDFMPPEFATQTSGRGSPQSDIYSIGITLYQSLTKKLPFPRLPEKESEAWVAFFKRANNPMECSFDFQVFKDNKQLASILRKALAHDPKNRFASAGAMRDQLKDFLASFDEATTAIKREDAEEDATVVAPPRFIEEHEAATKPADLFKMEQEVARLAAQQSAETEIEKKRTAGEELEKKRVADEKAAQERARVTAEQAEKKKKEDAERLEKKRAEDEKVQQERARLSAEEVEKKKREDAERLEKKRVEDEKAAQERARVAAEQAEKKKKEDAERLVREKEQRAREEAERKVREEAERKAAAEAAEQKRIRDEERARAAAARAEAMRKLMPKLIKLGSAGVAVIVLVVGGIFGWKKMQVQMRENAYHNAVSRAHNDFNSGNFNASIDDANKAMSYHANDPDMQQLIANAQMQLKLQQSYGDAIKNAQDTFNSHDYSNALTWAMAALQKEPNDSTATRIEQDAQSSLNDYHTAVDHANLAYKNNNFVDADTEAAKALAIYANDSTMQQLKASAEAQAGKQVAYNNDMTGAQTAYSSGDFNKAISLAGDALQQFPDDTSAKNMRDAAQKQINDYQAAVQAANDAFGKSDFTTAENEADQALAIVKNDDAMLKLKASAESQMKLHAAYAASYNNARTAFGAGDYANTVAYANQALQQVPGDASASQLRDQAQKFLDDYHAAVAAAKADSQKSDFADAVTEADKALAIYKTDTEMQRLESDAKTKLANQQAYTDAINNAQADMNNGNYADAVGWAKAALEKRPDDAAAVNIRDSAQKQLDAFGDIVKQAQDAFQKQDFANAVTLVNKALAIHKDDANAQKLKSDILRQLDVDLVTMLESFNVSVPSGIGYVNVKGVSTLGAIGDAGKPYYQGLADKLEKAYRLGNWLDQDSRQISIHDLRKAIDNWP